MPTEMEELRLARVLDQINACLAGKPCELKSIQFDGMTPVNVSAAFRSWEALHHMVEKHGVSLAAHATDVEFPLLCAVEHDNHSVVDYILDDPRRYTSDQLYLAIPAARDEAMRDKLSEAICGTEAERPPPAPSTTGESRAERFFRMAMEDPGEFIRNMTEYAESDARLREKIDALDAAEDVYNATKRRRDEAEAALRESEAALREAGHEHDKAKFNYKNKRRRLTDGACGTERPALRGASVSNE